jgi:hypothetical protein
MPHIRVSDDRRPIARTDKLMPVRLSPGCASGGTSSVGTMSSAITGIRIARVLPLDLSGPQSGCMDQAQSSGATALNVWASPFLFADREITLDRTAALRLPTISQWRDTAEKGGVAAYSPRFAKLYRQLARQLVKLLHGAKPGDTPTEQLTEFELVINLNTAKVLGLTIPDAMLDLADTVIE